MYASMVDIQSATAEIRRGKKERRKKKKEETTGQKYNGPQLHRAAIIIEMWADAQRDGRPAEYNWRPLFNATKFG